MLPASVGTWTHDIACSRHYWGRSSYVAELKSPAQIKTHGNVYVCSSMYMYSTCTYLHFGCKVHVQHCLQYRRTALHYASENGHHDTVKVLLERGAFPNVCDKVSGVCVTLYTCTCTSWIRGPCPASFTALEWQVFVGDEVVVLKPLNHKHSGAPWGVVFQTSYV